MLEVILIILIFCFLNQYLILDEFLYFFRTKIEKAKDDKMKEIEKDDPDLAKRIKEQRFGSEVYIKWRAKELGFITKTIGVIEIFFFTFLFYLTEPMNFLAALGVWIGIKTAVDYDQWSHPIVGKAYFYTSLLGTFLNIGLPVIAIFLFKNYCN